MISEAPYIKFKEKQICFMLREVTSHIVGYPTGPILQATGNHLTTLPPTLLGGQQVLPFPKRPIGIYSQISIYSKKSLLSQTL